MKELLLDANVLVRFLVQDDASQSPAATALLESADRQECRLHLDGLAIAECVYVLVGHYRRNRKDVVGALLTLIQSSGVVTADADVVSDALRRFAAVNVDFADAWLPPALRGLDMTWRRLAVTWTNSRTSAASSRSSEPGPRPTIRPDRSLVSPTGPAEPIFYLFRASRRPSRHLSPRSALLPFS